MKTLIQALLFLLLVTQICYPQVNWIKYEYNPVLSGNYGGYAWNNHLLTPCVIFNDELNQFEMWFSTGGAGRIGFAYSNDGISWTMHPDPVLEPSEGTWDSLAVSDPFVIRENGQYKMWYSSRNWNIQIFKIGYATSPDGINWTKYTANPIFEAGTNPYESGGVYGCCVMPVTGGYKMWYTVYDTSTTHESICYATSLDGILWQKDTLNNPVLEYGEPGEWDEEGIWFPRVLYLNNLYYMWYGGECNLINGTLWQLGLATSSDGINWIKSESNPVLSDVPDSLNPGAIQSGSVILVGDTLHMWYDENPPNPFAGKIFESIYLANSYFEATSVDIPNAYPTDYVLIQNYPNPFNPSTKISWQSPVGSWQTLKIYDVLGNEIKTLVNEYKPSGEYEIEFDAANFPSGVYFYQLKAGEVVSTKKMILLR